jgi:hypothetical protein
LVQHDGEEIKRGFTISDSQVEDQTNLTLEETNERPHFKDDVAFTSLNTIFLHTVAMLNEIDNLLGLDAILNGEPIGLGSCVSRQHGINNGEISNKGYIIL